METKQIQQFLEKHLIKVFFFILFLVPFFWFEYPKIDLGGDSGRIYLYDPGAVIINTAFYPINPWGGYDIYNPRYISIPMFTFFVTIKTIFFENSYLLNVIVNSLTLSFGFLYFIKFLEELTHTKDYDKYKIIKVFAGLFYTLSPVFIYDFQRANFHIYSLALFPLFFYHFLRFIKYTKIADILWLYILMFVFGMSFSAIVVPWVIAFFIPSMTLVFIYAVLNKKILRFAAGTLIALTLGLISQIFYLFPLAVSLIEPSNSKIYLNEDLALSGLGYFQTIKPYVDNIYNLYNQQPFNVMSTFGNKNYELMKTFGLYVLPVFSLYPLILLYALFSDSKKYLENKQSRLFLFAVLLFCIMLFLMSADLGILPVKIYEVMLLEIPGFRMFRHFYGKFALGFVFIYGTVLYQSLIILYEKYFKTKHGGMLNKMMYALIFIVLFNAIPLLSGMILNSQTPGANDLGKHVKVSVDIPDEYLESVKYLSSIKSELIVLNLPFSMENYQVLQGNGGGGYLGPSINSMISGKRDISGFHGLYNPDLGQTFYTLFFEESPEKMKRFLGLLNIGVIYHNSDPFIYQFFDATPWGEMKRLFPTQDSLKLLIQVLDAKYLFNSVSHFIYEIKDFFLPKIYSPEKVYVTDQKIHEFFRDNDFSNDPIRISVFEKGDLSNISPDLMTKVSSSPKITFTKVSPVKYLVDVDNFNDPFILVLSEPFNNKWKLFYQDMNLNQIENPALRNLGRNYGSIISGITAGSGTVEYETEYFGGDIKEIILRSPYLLPDTFETWGLTPVFDDSHYYVNGYANAWYISDRSLPQDNNTSLKLILEYTGHRHFYLTGAVSLSVFVLSVSILAVIYTVNFVKSGGFGKMKLSGLKTGVSSSQKKSTHLRPKDLERSASENIN